MNKKILAVLVVTFNLIGCTTMGTPYQPAPVAPAGKGTVYLMRSQVGFGNFWPTVFSVNDVPVVSLHDKGYTYIYLDRGMYKFSGGTHLQKDYLHFTKPIDAGGEYYIEYHQESAGYQTVRNEIRTVPIGEAKNMIANFSYMAANLVEIPNSTPIAASENFGKVAEAHYVKRIAKENKCEVKGEPRMSFASDSKNRLYEVDCDGGTVKKFECGVVKEGYSNQSCWLI